MKTDTIDTEKQIKSQLVYNRQPLWIKAFFYILDIFYSLEVKKLKEYLWEKEKPLKKQVIEEEKEFSKKYTNNEKHKYGLARGFRKIEKIEKQINKEFEQKNNKLIDKYNNIKLKWIKTT